MSKGFCRFEGNVRVHSSVWKSTTFNHVLQMSKVTRQNTVKTKATLQKSNLVISWHSIKES